MKKIKPTPTLTTMSYIMEELKPLVDKFRGYEEHTITPPEVTCITKKILTQLDKDIEGEEFNDEFRAAQAAMIINSLIAALSAARDAEFPDAI